MKLLRMEWMAFACVHIKHVWLQQNTHLTRALLRNFIREKNVSLHILNEELSRKKLSLLNETSLTNLFT